MGQIGIKMLEVGPERAIAEMEALPDVMTLTGHIHAGAMIWLADSTATFVAVAFIKGSYVELDRFPVTIGTRHLADLDFRRGLDLQGGLHVRFAADPGPDQVVDADTMEAVRQIIENRVNGLGVAEPVIQIEGDNRLMSYALAPPMGRMDNPFVLVWAMQ